MVDYTGRWRCAIRTPLGVQDVVLTIEERDGRLRGEVVGVETVPMIAPEVLDGRLCWTQRVTKPMRLTIAFDVVRDGDRLSGTAKPGLFPRARVEGTRVAETEGAAPGRGRQDREAPGREGEAAPSRAARGWPRLSVDTSAMGGRPLRVGMFVFPGMTALDLVGPQAVLSGPTEVQLFGRTRDAVLSDTGVAITPDMAFDEVPAELDVLFVPGGPGQVAVMRDDAALAFLADRGARARHVTSVCTGSLILGAAGLLRGYRATTHWAALGLLPVFGAEPVEERVVVDRNRTTGGGVTAGIDFGLALLSRLFDERVARTTELLMEYAPHPPFGCGRPEQAGDALTAEALRILAPAADDVMRVVAERFA